MSEAVHTREELEYMIERMRAASLEFYSNATTLGNHPFIEFCGLLNEYIQCCEVAMKEGIDFTQCNVHTGQQLPMKDHNLSYMQEKLECIFTGCEVIRKQGD